MQLNQFILSAVIVQYLECRITRREFGDIGDEVSTNLPVRKSFIPKEYTESEKIRIQKKFGVENLGGKHLMGTKTLVHHINPLYNRDFVTIETRPSFGNLKRNITSMSLDEKKDTIPDFQNPFNRFAERFNWQKRSYIPLRKKYSIHSTQHTHPRWQLPHRNIVINPLMKRAFYKHIDKNAATRSFINSRPGLLPYSFRPHSKRLPWSHGNSYFLQNKKSILKSWRNNLFRRNPLHEIDRKRKFHHYRTNNRTSYLVKQAKKYHDNSLLNDLSKVTMKWTGVKDSATVNVSSLPPWFSTLKKVIQPKVKYRSSKHLMKAPIEKQRLNAATGPVDKAKMKAIMNSIYPSPKIFPLTKDVHSSRPLVRIRPKPVKIDQVEKMRPKEVKTEVETNIDTDARRNTSVSTAKKQQLQLYQGVSISRNPSESAVSSPYYPASSYPPTSYNSDFKPPKHGLNFVPWNYYHSEYLADGRIRPALYPIAKHIPEGRCLPENSLCDLGHDEQCCGAATFCVNYWGLNKCLPFRRINPEEEFNPYQVQNDKYYKSYYNYYLANVKASSGIYK